MKKHIKSKIQQYVFHHQEDWWRNPSRTVTTDSESNAWYGLINKLYLRNMDKKEQLEYLFEWGLNEKKY